MQVMFFSIQTARVAVTTIVTKVWQNTVDSELKKKTGRNNRNIRNKK